MAPEPRLAIGAEEGTLPSLPRISRAGIVAGGGHMSASAKELVEQSETHRALKRLPEALASAIAATRADPQDANAWWQVALNRRDLGQAEHAKSALLELVDLAPWFASGWAELGKIEMAERDDEEAVISFENALEYEGDHLVALSNLAKIYGQRDVDHEDATNEVKLLEKLVELGRASSSQLNRLGRLHYAAKRYFDAIKNWKEASSASPDAAHYFNLGLAYGTAEVGQATNAIDCFRRALELDPSYEKARDQIARLLPAALARGNAVADVAPTILPTQAWYATYLNPYQLLAATDAVEAQLDAPLDPKALQRLRKRVLQEIELEDGALSWMPSLRIDRSRAIAVIDELNNEELAWYHLYVYQDSKLLDFLTTGAHSHFLVDATKSPLETLEHIDSDQSFLAWLGKYFSVQFDAVMSRAIAASKLHIVAQLTSGRRWVSAAQSDACFESSRRALDRLLIPLRELVGQSEGRLIGGAEVERFLGRNRLLECINALPVQFRDFQSEVGDSLRSIALACNNEHGDPEEAQRVLEQVATLRFKSADLEHRIQEDVEQLGKLIENLKRHEFHFTPPGQQPWSITRNRIAKGRDEATHHDVFGVRWGATFSRVTNGVQIDQEIAFWIDPGREIRFALRDVRTSTAETRTEQRFKEMIGAALNYIVPTLIERLEKHIRSGNALQVGPCRFTRDGAAYETRGLIFSKDNLVSWRDMHTDMRNGAVHIASRSGSAKPITLDMRTHYNAAMIPLIKAAMTGEK